MKKNSSRGPKHGVSERQVMFCRAKEMLKKARQPKHGGHPTILARWYAQKGYRESLAEHNIGEKEVTLSDRIALERHDYTATRAERLQNAKHWILRLNADGPQKRLFDSDQKQRLHLQLRCGKTRVEHAVWTSQWSVHHQRGAGGRDMCNF